MKSIILISLIIGAVTMLFFHANSAAVSGLDQGQSDKSDPSSDYINGKFKNEAEPLNISAVEFVSSTWDFLFGGQDRTPEMELPIKSVDLTHINNSANHQLNVTWLGHSSLMINIDGYRILTDPVFEKRISLLGPTRFNGEVPLNIEQVSPIDAVIISHDHYDHLNKYSVQRLKDKVGRFLVPLGVGVRLVKWGVPAEKIIELDWWEEYRHNGNLMFAATPAQHFSGRGLTDRNITLWSSWVVKTPSHSFFFSGDSGYFEGFKQIGIKYGPFDMTFIECGAYNKSWSQVHMFPEQTVQAHIDLKGKILHPIHWGTFNLALHPWYEPMERLTATAQANNIKVATPIVGETTIFDTNLHVAKWWQHAMAHKEITKFSIKN